MCAARSLRQHEPMQSKPFNAAIKLLTINIHKGVGQWRRRPILNGLKEAVTQLDVDVVCLQEVQGGRKGQAPQVETLADGIWPEHAYGRNAAGPMGDHGNAVLSRWPIAQVCNHDVSQAGDEARGILHCRLALPGMRDGFHVLCVHFGLREAHRQHQLSQLLKLLGEFPPLAPVVVAGDFNDWRNRADARLAPSGLREVHVSHHGRARRSFPAQWPVLALDRIYVRGLAAARPLQLPRRPWSALSDHIPVGAALSLQTEAL